MALPTPAALDQSPPRAIVRHFHSAGAVGRINTPLELKDEALPRQGQRATSCNADNHSERESHEPKR